MQKRREPGRMTIIRMAAPKKTSEDACLQNLPLLLNIKIRITGAHLPVPLTQGSDSYMSDKMKGKKKKVFDLASDSWTIKIFIKEGGDDVSLNTDSQHQSIRAVQ
ncbi:hypothetical protein CapIbe_008722 [Capra ibex]